MKQTTAVTLLIVVSAVIIGSIGILSATISPYLRTQTVVGPYVAEGIPQDVIEQEEFLQEQSLSEAPATDQDVSNLIDEQDCRRMLNTARQNCYKSTADPTCFNDSEQAFQFCRQ